jgi:transcriptional regulator with XRE-family HTH domain
MSEQPAAGDLPRWDLADRMRKSLRVSGISVQEMAEYLDVDRSTVSTWINGRIEPSVQTAKLWALRTGVPYTYLCHGNANPCILGPERVTDGTFSQVRRRVNNMQSSRTNMRVA